MKSPVVAGLALALTLSASPLLAAKMNLKADLEGSSAGSAATGTGNFTYDDVAGRLCGKVTFTALESGAVTAVVLKTVPGVQATTVLKTLTPGPSPLTVSVSMTAADGAKIMDPGLYLAIGTAADPAGANDDNGEINGELLEDPAGVEQTCPAVGIDGGVDSGTDSGTTSSSSSSSSSGASSSSGDPSSSSSSSSGDDGSSGDTGTKKPAAKKDSGGCSTSGSASGGGLALAALIGLTLLSRGRSRRR